MEGISVGELLATEENFWTVCEGHLRSNGSYIAATSTIIDTESPYLQVIQ